MPHAAEKCCCKLIIQIQSDFQLNLFLVLPTLTVMPLVVEVIVICRLRKIVVEDCVEQKVHQSLFSMQKVYCVFRFTVFVCVLGMVP